MSLHILSLSILSHSYNRFRAGAYQKFEAATWRFLRLAGVDPALARTVFALTHYKAELRQREIYRIETVLIACGDAPTIGHK